MKIKLQQANKKYIERFLSKRTGESKYGEHLQTLKNKNNISNQLKENTCKYVLLGIPEDLGVYANFGVRGAKSTWDIFLPYLLNTQHNTLNQGNQLLLLGHLSIPEETHDFLNNTNWDQQKKLTHARLLVEELDKIVSFYIREIAAAGKKAIVVGGGHNNAYGLLKGFALHHNQPMNVINFDAHADLRKLEGRHSGNGFSYAHHEGFLQKYFAFGLHENYIDPHAFQLFINSTNLNYCTYEEMMVRKTTSFKKQLKKGLQFVGKQPFGIELDCDTILEYPSSAQTPSGFTALEARKYVHFLGTHKNAQYLHLCEAALTKKSKKYYGKLLAYFITDFIKASS